MTGTHSLTVVLPAYNEQGAIVDTLRQLCAAGPKVCEEAQLSDVQIVVVNDGSTDKTEELARQFKQVAVLSFDKNRGYGAALKTGIAGARTDLVGFMDADGTCDPRAFGSLCQAISSQDADLAVGVRLGPDTEMPSVRKLGNRLFAFLLGILSRQRVQDSASGMRVLRRSSFEKMLPLPDGLHFTPAMSARVLLKGDLKLAETPIPYAERTGRSKLSVLKDGFRFLSVILKTALLFRPLRVLGPVALVFALAAAAVGVVPGLHYLSYGALEEWMVYRVLLAFLFLVVCSALMSAGVVAQSIVEAINLAEKGPPAKANPKITFVRGGIRMLSGVLFVLAVIVVWPGLTEYFSLGTVSLHWSRLVLAMLFVIWATLLVTTQVLDGLARVLAMRFAPLGGVLEPDRVRHAQTNIEA